eukprot:m.211880 g.211880  ORF g.211880 m.211880 type:complete len:107 (+) comp39763_c0_seq9:101-421(+)
MASTVIVRRKMQYEANLWQDSRVMKIGKALLGTVTVKVIVAYWIIQREICSAQVRSTRERDSSAELILSEVLLVSLQRLLSCPCKLRSQVRYFLKISPQKNILFGR